MSWCGCFCDIAEEIVEEIVETADQAYDVVANPGDAIDALGEALETFGEWIIEQGEEIKETGEAFKQRVLEAAEKAWEWVASTGQSIWDWVKSKATDAWEWTTGAAESVWAWVTEKATDAWNWTVGAGETVWKTLCSVASELKAFWDERVVPMLTTLLWALSHIDELLLSLAGRLVCLLFGGDDRDYTLLEGLNDGDPEILKERAVAFLPIEGRYVVFSDHHLFIAGDAKEFFRQTGTDRLYQAVLVTYAAAGYTLIEAGDVEDLWLHEGTLSEACWEMGFDALGWPIGTSAQEDYEDYRVREQSYKIFRDNAETYQLIRALFHDKGRYIRLVGNHDSYWRDPDYLEGLRQIYPGIVAYDYAFIGGSQNPRFILAHGHQYDGWNDYACEFAGSLITECVSYNPDLALDTESRGSWESKLYVNGFDNTLLPSWRDIDEVDFYWEVQEDLRSSRPFFVLGHTHKARKDSVVPGYEAVYRMPNLDTGCSDFYLNDGTAGRWEQFIWCVVIDQGTPSLAAWCVDRGGAVAGYTFDANRDSCRLEARPVA